MKTSLAACIVLILFLVVGLYSHFIETQWLETTHHVFKSSLRRPLKLAHLTDLHVRALGRLEQKIFSELENEKVDLIVITGDSVAPSGDYGMARNFLSQLKAPLGVWSIDGNWEHWTSNGNSGRELAGLPNVTLLNNENRQIREDVWLVGLDDSLAGTPDLESAFKEKPPEKFCITLFHSPEYFPAVAGKCPLNLSGHTHGGQIRIPFLGSLWLPPGSGGFVSGWYDEKDSQMYVSRGTGTSVLNARFLCRPEIAIITIQGGT